MIADASCISPLRLIRPPRGRLNSCARRFLGMRRLDMYPRSRSCVRRLGALRSYGNLGSADGLALAWQNAYVERFIGSARRECLNHVTVWSATGLRRLLNEYVAYYTASRTHLALKKDAPAPRPVMPPILGHVVAVPQVGGLHHRYERRAA